MSNTVELDDLSLAATSLLRGAVYAEDSRVWRAVTEAEPRVREYVRTLGLRLVIDRADGYALLRTEDELPEGLPRLVRRHALSLHATVLLILLRQRMLTADAAGDLPRIILPTSELVEMLRIYHREGTTEERILRDVNTLENLGYLRKISDEQNSFEARRIIKAIMTAEWVAEYQAKVLAAATGADGDPSPTPDDDAHTDLDGPTDLDAADAADVVAEAADGAHDGGAAELDEPVPFTTGGSGPDGATPLDLSAMDQRGDRAEEDA